MLPLQTTELEAMSRNLEEVALVAAEIWQTPKESPTIEFLEENYYLPDAGRYYEFWYAPYFLGVAVALDEPETHEVDLQKASQIGWTYFILGYICKRIREAIMRRCPIMGLFGKTGDAKNFHDEKLVEVVRENDFISDILDITTSRKSGNRWDNKSYPGGFLKLVGSNSPGNVKSTSSVGVGFVEEPDDTQDNVAGQGDSIGNIEERLKRYIGSKLIVGGTPAVRGLSKIEARLEQTDKRELPIRCHDCGETHVLDWDNVIWDTVERDVPHPVYGNDDPDTAVYVCPNCGSPWDDRQRQTNIRTTCFDAYNAYLAGDESAKYCGWTPTAEFYGKAGFHGLSELYVCMPGTSLADVVKDFLFAMSEAEKGKESALIKFTNQKLGLSYEFKSDNATADELRERSKKNTYPELQVPRRGLILTCGVDIQRDRIAVIIRAWGKDMESWLVYWGEMYARHDINDINDPVWSALDRVIFGGYRHESGAVLSIRACSLDTSDGVTQGATYHYVRSRQNRGVNLMAIKGSSSYDAPIVSLPKKLELNAQKTKADKFGLKIWNIGTQAAKDLIAGRLKLEGEGAGRMHVYRDVRADYFDQITGEIKAPSKSQPNKMVWQQRSGASVEGGDCEVYACHAAHVEKLHIKKPQWWDSVEANLVQVDLLGGDDDIEVVSVIDERPDSDCEPAEIAQVREDRDEAPIVAVTKTVAAEKPAAKKARSLADIGRMMGGGG